MSGPLFLVVTAGVFATGCLFHTDHPIYALCVGLAAYVVARWIWSVYTD